MEISKPIKFQITDQSIDQAKTLIEEERSGEQYGLMCRFQTLNRAVIKYFRFSQVYLIAARSGSGKSAILNILRTDFLSLEDKFVPSDSNFYLGNTSVELEHPKYGWCEYYHDSRITVLEDGRYMLPGINQKYVHKDKVVILHFGPEMAPEIEIIRTASSIIGKGFPELTSSEWDADAKKYKLLNDKDFKTTIGVLESLRGRREYYVPISGNHLQMQATIDYVMEKNPDCKLVVTFDHILLAKRMGAQGEAELIESIALLAIYTRQTYNAMVILVAQFNNAIESPERKRHPDGHYPGKPDIHHGSKVWWASDNVIMFHRPELLNIARYGPYQLDTENLIHGFVAKSRNGELGNIWLKADFDHGRILEAKRSNFYIE